MGDMASWRLASDLRYRCRAARGQQQSGSAHSVPPAPLPGGVNLWQQADIRVYRQPVARDYVLQEADRKGEPKQLLEDKDLLAIGL